jgi:hypothetical protein
LNKRRRFYSIIYCLLFGLMVFKTLLAAFITDPQLLILIGDVSYFTGERVVINIVLFFGLFNCFVNRILLIFGKYYFKRSVRESRLSSLYRQLVLSISIACSRDSHETLEIHKSYQDQENYLIKNEISWKILLTTEYLVNKWLIVVISVVFFNCLFNNLQSLENVVWKNDANKSMGFCLLMQSGSDDIF